MRIFRNEYFWLLIILFLGLMLRLYKIDSPIADWHSWRQADTAAVTRNFIKEGFNPLLPRFDDMSSISENPTPNPAGFRFVEFPLYNTFVYPLYLVFGINESLHRLVSVIFSLGSSVMLFLILRRYLNTLTRLLAVSIYTFLPYNIYFSRTTLPEPLFVFLALGMVYFLDRWIFSNRLFDATVGAVFLALAFLEKPWAVFFLLPLFHSVIHKEGNVGKNLSKFLMLIILSLLPFLLWRMWILQQPEGIPASSWLFNDKAIRFRPAFWWWIISERLGREILGVTGLFLMLLGLITKPKLGNYFLHFWFLSVALYLIVVAGGNVRHDYYQYIIVPVISIFVAKGFLGLIDGFSDFIPRFWTIVLAVMFLPLTLYFTWIQVRGLYQINNPAIILAGKQADQILAKDAKVIAPYNGDTAFLYQTNRAGFPTIPSTVTDLISDYGVTAYISVSHDAKTNWVARHFKILADRSEYLIADLRYPTGKLVDPKDPEP